MSELEQRHESEQEKMAAAFNHVVERATTAEMAMREEGSRTTIYHGGQIAGNNISIGSSTISFARHDLQRGRYLVGGLDFPTEFTVSINQRHSFFGASIDTATFGVNEDRSIVRALHAGDVIFGTKLLRDLGLEESAALVEFIASPHMNLDKLELIYRLSEVDKESLERQKARLAKHEEKRRSALERRGGRIRVPGLRPRRH